MPPRETDESDGIACEALERIVAAMFSPPGFLVGRRAIIKGILNEPALNGQVAAVKSFEASRAGRYVIELSGGSNPLI